MPERDTPATGSCASGPLLFATGRALDHFARFLAATHDVYVPAAAENCGTKVLGRLAPGEGATVPWNDHRLPVPLKGLWLQPAARLATWGEDGPRSCPPPPPRAVFGAKACDLGALAVLDRVFLEHDYREPRYAAARERNVVISGDCTAAHETCFCTVLGGGPFPAGRFDLNLSPVAGGFVVEVGSATGRNLTNVCGDLFRTASEVEVAERARGRERVEAELRETNRRFEAATDRTDAVRRCLSTPIWGILAERCVECNACNHVCPTCHCFLLLDSRAPGAAVRTSLWDSCFHAGHARMAGGGTPRLQLTERFKNHYFHKFLSFPENWGVEACTGCGRCSEACLGGIDKRECLLRLAMGWLPAEVST